MTLKLTQAELAILVEAYHSLGKRLSVRRAWLSVLDELFLSEEEAEKLLAKIDRHIMEDDVNGIDDRVEIVEEAE